MDREQIYAEIKERFGLVPGVFKVLSDSTLEHEWNIIKNLELNDTLIPGKYKHLAGVAAAAAARCRFCALFCTTMAKLNGASDEEIEEAVHVAKNVSGWSAYLHGLQVDYEEFRREMEEASAYIRQRGFERAA